MGNYYDLCLFGTTLRDVDAARQRVDTLRKTQQMSLNSVLTAAVTNSSDTVLISKTESISCRETLVSYMASNSSRQDVLGECGFAPFFDITCKGSMDTRTGKIISEMAEDKLAALNHQLRMIIGIGNYTMYKLSVDSGYNIRLTYPRYKWVNPIRVSAALLYLRLFSRFNAVNPKFGFLASLNNTFSMLIKHSYEIGASDGVWGGINEDGIYLLAAFLFACPGFNTTSYMFNSNGPSSYLLNNHLPSITWKAIVSAARKAGNKDAYRTLGVNIPNLRTIIIQEEAENLASEMSKIVYEPEEVHE
jgi:hypothetical protein